MKYLISFLALTFCYNSMTAQFKYPQARKSEQTDDYHGMQVADPYRWLEDDRSAETAAWVKAENEVTFGYLNTIPNRDKLKKRCEEVFNYEKYSSPYRNGDWYYFYKNDGLQNQSVLYRQKELDGKPELVLDPNKLSEEGTSRLMQFVVSKNGKYAAYAVSKGGSDWQEIFVMDMATKTKISDKIEWVKVSSIAWQGNGFYYSRYPEPKGSELSAKNENHQVYFHTIGKAQKEDELMYEDKANPQRFHTVSTSEDEHYAFLTISDRGKGVEGNALHYAIDGSKGFKPIRREFNGFEYNFIGNIGDKFLISTTANAPNSKVMLFDPRMPDENDWKIILPEEPRPMLYASTASGKLFAVYLEDVATKAYVYGLDGSLENEIELPGVGTVSGFGGNHDDTFVFYTYTSFSTPSTIYKYDIRTKQSSIFRKLNLPFNPEQFETTQVFYPSKDGTKIPMFITYKKGVKMDGNNPTMLYGYGGFNINVQPSFSSLLVPFLENGGVYASANLRGGGEYGETWHEQGIKLKKQNVFDDCIAAAEYLIAQKWTSPKKLGIRGGSNGGLLVGAVINQRPDLFAVAIPQVGVMDMLRFHTFTIGWNWKPDYGSSENADEFKALYAYSPIHNIKEGIAYPATLVTTADHDDRVVPAHSFKYAATLQAQYTGNQPVMIRVDVNSGHGASNTKKNIEMMADIYAFMFQNMGVKIK
jgi:prolyl oligopeptidase